MRCVGCAAAIVVAGAVALGGVRGGAQGGVRGGVGGTSVAEQYLFAAANAERVQRGLQPLRWDEAMYRAADAHAREMAARGAISHQFPGEMDLAERGRQAGARFSVIAENVAEAPTAVRIHDAWMNSEGHRANLLDARVDSVGIRVLSRGGELYAVEDFARGVADVPAAEQERMVGELVRGAVGGGAGITLMASGEEVRSGCADGVSSVGGRKAGFVMRYTTAELGVLPEALRTELASGRFSQAAVGACGVAETGTFSTFSIVVMLFR